MIRNLSFNLKKNNNSDNGNREITINDIKKKYNKKIPNSTTKIKKTNFFNTEMSIDNVKKNNNINEPQI